MASAAPTTANIVTRTSRAVLAALVGLAGVILLVFASIAVAAFGLVIAAVALFGRLTRRKPARRERGEMILEGRRTADGWVAEPPAA